VTVCHLSRLLMPRIISLFMHHAKPYGRKILQRLVAVSGWGGDELGIVVPRPSALALLTGRMQKGFFMTNLMTNAT
jgi:hypothetical protein